MMVLLIVGYALIAAIQVPGLVKKKYWRELVFFSLFFLLSFVLFVLHIAGVKLPNSIKGIEGFFNAINLHF